MNLSNLFFLALATIGIASCTTTHSSSPDDAATTAPPPRGYTAPISPYTPPSGS